MENSKRPYSLLVWPNQRKALAMMWQARGTEDAYSCGVAELEGSFTALRSVAIQLS